MDWWKRRSSLPAAILTLETRVFSTSHSRAQLSWVDNSNNHVIIGDTSDKCEHGSLKGFAIAGRPVQADSCDQVWNQALVTLIYITGQGQGEAQMDTAAASDDAANAAMQPLSLKCDEWVRLLYTSPPSKQASTPPPSKQASTPPPL